MFLGSVRQRPTAKSAAVLNERDTDFIAFTPAQLGAVRFARALDYKLELAWD